MDAASIPDIRCTPWIDNYCKANPIEPIEIAAKQFYVAHPH